MHHTSGRARHCGALALATMLSNVRNRGTTVTRGVSSLLHVSHQNERNDDAAPRGKTSGFSQGERAYSASTRATSAFTGRDALSSFIRAPSSTPFAASVHASVTGRLPSSGAMTSQRRGLFGLRKKKAAETVMDGATDVSGAGDVLGGAGEVIPAVTTIASEVVPVAAQSWPTTAALMYAMEYFHVTHGYEWWLAIVGATVFMRTVTFPLTVMQMRNTARLQLAKPEIEALQSKMKDNPQQDPELATAYYKELQGVWKKYDASPFKSFGPILINAPIFISFYFAISKMAAGVPSFQTGGPAMFTDLSIADPTYALPILSSLTFLASVELGAVEGVQTGRQSMNMKWFLRALSVAMVPLTASFPQGVFVYWITSNTFSGFQTLLTRTKAFKSVVGIPDVSAVAEAPADAALSRVQLDQFQKKYGANPTLHARPPPTAKSRRALKR